MIVEVKLFAAARQYANADTLAVEIGEATNIRELRAAIAAKCPALSPLLASSMIAVNHEYAGDDMSIPPESEIALIPPVSGG